MEKAWLGLGRSADPSEGVDETWPPCGQGPPICWMEFRTGCSVCRKVSEWQISPEGACVGEMLVFRA